MAAVGEARIKVTLDMSDAQAFSERGAGSGSRSPLAQPPARPYEAQDRSGTVQGKPPSLRGAVGAVTAIPAAASPRSSFGTTQYAVGAVARAWDKRQARLHREAVAQGADPDAPTVMGRIAGVAGGIAVGVAAGAAVQAVLPLVSEALKQIPYVPDSVVKFVDKRLEAIQQSMAALHATLGTIGGALDIGVAAAVLDPSGFSFKEGAQLGRDLAEVQAFRSQVAGKVMEARTRQVAEGLKAGGGAGVVFGAAKGLGGANVDATLGAIAGGLIPLPGGPQDGGEIRAAIVKALRDGRPHG